MDTSTDGYIDRIRARLMDGSPEAVLYAAFELRCAVEGRLKFYIEPLKHLPKAKLREWEISKLGRTLKDAFKSDNLVAIVKINLPGEVLPLRLQYVPVSKQLQDIAKRAGDWLHYPGARAHDESWFVNIRKEISVGLAWLEYAATGELRGIPLLNSTTKVASLDAYLHADDPRIHSFKRLVQGGMALIHVDYIELPKQPTGTGRLLASDSISTTPS